MKSIKKLAVVDEGKCNLCGVCVKLCPVEAIAVHASGTGKKLVTDEKQCRACTICVTRCPQNARSLAERTQPLELDLTVKGDFTREAVAALCNKAHMYPEQVVCYCYRTTAANIAEAVLAGAKTPEDVSRMTGARTGCGVLCVSSILRIMRAAHIELGKAPGFQWYGNIATIWDVPEAVIKKYGKEYYLEEDRKSMDRLYPGAGGDK